MLSPQLLPVLHAYWRPAKLLSPAGNEVQGASRAEWLAARPARDPRAATGPRLGWGTAASPDGVAVQRMRCGPRRGLYPACRFERCCGPGRPDGGREECTAREAAASPRGSVQSGFNEVALRTSCELIVARGLTGVSQFLFKHLFQPSLLLSSKLYAR